MAPAENSEVMAFWKRRKNEASGATRRRRIESDRGTSWSLINLKRLIYGLVFLAFAGLLVLVCFVGLSPAGPQLIAKQPARIRVVAEIPFSYESKILTEQLIQQRKKRVPPVYRLNLEPYNRFEEYSQRLSESLQTLEEQLTDTPLEEHAARIETFAREFEPGSSYNFTAEDIVVLLNEADLEHREIVLKEALTILQEIFLEGVYDSEHSEIKADIGNLSFFNVHKDSGHITQVEVQSEEDALRYLRINLSALDISRELSGTLYRLFRKVLTPNLIYDQAKSDEKIKLVISKVNPVEINVEEGETIIEPGVKVSKLDLEKRAAYLQSLKRATDLSIAFSSLLWERLLLTIAILLSGGLFLRIVGISLPTLKQHFLLSATVAIANLAIVRLILELGEAYTMGGFGIDLTAVIPYLAPVALGPILITILAGSGSGVFAALLISLFIALMQGNSIPIFLVSLLSSLFAIYYCRDVQVRAKVVRAGAYSGLSVAFCAFFFGLRDVLDLVVIGNQIFVSLAMGVVTGIAVVGFLPILEHLFHLTTNITLLELTDFNHPLLRRMQVSAPGSYHHSLMVANLSENAALGIGANPLVCRVSSLFHDIGKTIKPEYFTENQSQGVNPHLRKNPSMSALVIKSHVKEGVRLAEQTKLPKLIIDVIMQHHGTTLIQYFYYKALQEKKKSSTPPYFPGTPRIDIDDVNENTYRYDGPKPKFKESAIIFFADSIEAASRSLPKVTSQAIDELLERIFQERLDDEQLVECPLTFEEIKEIKRSFSFTLLNMLHARIEYPPKAEEAKPERKAAPRQKEVARRKPERPKEIPSELAPTLKSISESETDSTYAGIEESRAPHPDSQSV